MEDQYKTKEELINELIELRRRMTELEKSEAERKRAEEMLRKSEERYRRLIEESPIIVWSSSDKRGTIYVSSRVESILGYPPDFLYENPWLWNQSIHPQDQPRLAQAIEDFALGKDLCVEYRIKDSTGNWRWFDDRSIGRRVIEGETIIEGISTDITGRKQAEEALREREQEIRVIADNVPALFSYVDADGRYRFVNKRYEEWFELPRAEIIGKHYREVLGEATYKVIKERVETVLAGHRVHYEETLPYVHGGTRWVSADYVPDIDENRKVNGFFALVTDITERKRAEEALRIERNKLEAVTRHIGAGLAIISKDYRTLWGNETLKQIFGDIEGKICYSTYNQRTEICPGCSVREVFKKGSDRVVHEQVGKDIQGNTIWSEIIATPIKDSEGNITEVLELVIPITERKRAEDEIKNLAKFPAENPFPVFRLNKNGIILYANKASYVLLQDWGCTVGGYAPKFWGDLVAEALASQSRRTIDVGCGQQVYSFVVAPISDAGYVNLYGIDITERKQAEEALFREKLLSDSIVENMPSGIGFLDTEFVLRKFNQAYAQLIRTYTPYSPEQALGMSYFELVPGSREQVEEWFRRVRDSGQTETRYGFKLVIKQDGREEATYRDTSIAPVKRPDGTMEGILILTQDVTKRKMAEEALKESERKFKTIFDSASDGMFLFDLETRKFVMCNAMCSKMLGFTQEEFLNLDIPDLHPPEDLPFIFEQIGKFMKEEKGVRSDIRFRRKDGPVFFTDLSPALMTLAERKFVLVVFKDITERKRTERALRESESRFHAIAANTPDHVLMLDRDLRYEFVINPQLGLTEADMIGKTDRDILGEKDAEKLTLIKREVLETGEPVRLETSLQNLKGETEFFEGAYIPKLDATGKADGLIGYSKNVTERKRAEEKLRSSHEQLRALSTHLQFVREEERTTIAREIHDELGQGLTGLKMDLSWLRKKLPKREKILVEKTQSMLKLIDTTIQSVRKISTELRPGVLDDLGLISAIEWQVQDFQDRKGIKCEFNSSLEEIDLDRERSTAVFRIFQETLTNVARHANATRVNINLREEDSNLILEVKDNGKGITESEISDPKSLGLLGIRERALLFGGEVKISGKPGEGTTVMVSIPLSK